MVITSTLRWAPWMFTASTSKDLYTGSGTSRAERVATWNRQDSSVVHSQGGGLRPISRAGFFNEIVPRRSARDQLWTVRRVMPCFNNRAQMQFLGRDSVANGGVFVAHRLSVKLQICINLSDILGSIIPFKHDYQGNARFYQENIWFEHFLQVMRFVSESDRSVRCYSSLHCSSRRCIS